MKSIWVHELKGYEECRGYKVYEDGTIESYKNSQGEILDDPTRKLKGSLDNKGYSRVDLKPKRSIKIHRLVAIAFLENPFNKPQVNHKDGKKTNNHYTNLEWVTNSENQLHANVLGLRKSPKGEANYQYNSEHKNCKKVRQLTMDGKEIAIHNSLAMAGRSVGKGYTTISKCCRGIGDTAYGYKWEFVNV